MKFLTTQLFDKSNYGHALKSFVRLRLFLKSLSIIGIIIYFNIWQTQTDKLREDMKCMSCLLNMNFGLSLWALGIKYTVL